MFGVRAWIITDYFCWMAHFILSHRFTVTEIPDWRKKKCRKGGEGIITGWQFLSNYFCQSWVIIRGSWLIEGRLLFVEVREYDKYAGQSVNQSIDPSINQPREHVFADFVHKFSNRSCPRLLPCGAVLVPQETGATPDKWPFMLHFWLRSQRDVSNRLRLLVPTPFA